MREAYHEFYRPSREDTKRFMLTATVALDANVLLGLYSVSGSEREQILTVLEAISDRLWLPFQAGLEYQRLRMSVISAQASAYEQTGRIHGVRSGDEMQSKLFGANLPDRVKVEIEPLLGDLVDQLEPVMAEYESKVEEIARRHVITVAQARELDPVRERLDALFADRVGPRLSEDEIAARVKVGVNRVTNKVPPGYKDAAKDSDLGKAGDYLIWSQILDFAKDTDKPFLFVTRDEKEDWFDRIGREREIVGPRVELVAEFARNSSHGYHQLTLATFLQMANQFLAASVEPETIDRVSETADATLGTLIGPAGSYGVLGSFDPTEIARRAIEAGMSVTPDEIARRAFASRMEPTNLAMGPVARAVGNYGTGSISEAYDRIYKRRNAQKDEQLPQGKQPPQEDPR